MAETSYLWDNPGTGDSPALGYGHQEFMEEMFRMLLNTTGNYGVYPRWLNELEVTDGGGLNAAVDTGAAGVYGFWYENDAATNVVMPNNAVNHVVVRCSWAAQTARLTQVAALVQNPGVTYDIPLATVTTAGGAIALIVDTRVYCEFPTIIADQGVEADNIQTGAVTTAKIQDITRTFSLGAGSYEPDATNPCTWASHTGAGYYRRDQFDFVDAATNAFYMTFIVPADISGANVTIDIWYGNYSGSGNVKWNYSAYTAAAGGVLANSAGNIVVASSYDVPIAGLFRQQLCSLALNAGDICHIQVARDGAHANDTLADTAFLMLATMEYTADS